jgi:hypothetical protein
MPAHPGQGITFGERNAVGPRVQPGTAVRRGVFAACLLPAARRLEHLS